MHRQVGILGNLDDRCQDLICFPTCRGCISKQCQHSVFNGNLAFVEATGECVDFLAWRRSLSASF